MLADNSGIPRCITTAKGGRQWIKEPLIAVVVIVVAVIAIAAIILVVSRKRRSETLKQRFGPEYE